MEGDGTDPETVRKATSQEGETGVKLWDRVEDRGGGPSKGSDPGLSPERETEGVRRENTGRHTDTKDERRETPTFEEPVK